MASAPLQSALVNVGTATPQGLQRFLEAKDLNILQDHPLVFEKSESFSSYLCCCGVCTCLASMGFSSFITPIWAFNGSSLAKYFHLQVDKDAVQFDSAINDCCCHIATRQQTVPLDKIQDVELDKPCYATMFGLERIMIQTAAQGGPTPEVQAFFLKHPAQVRECIRMAVKLHRQETIAPVQNVMERDGDCLAGRLQTLNHLVQTGELSTDEAQSIRVATLAAEINPLHKLIEAADLLKKQLISAAEFSELKSTLLSRITPASLAG